MDFSPGLIMSAVEIVGTGKKYNRGGVEETDSPGICAAAQDMRIEVKCHGSVLWRRLQGAIHKQPLVKWHRRVKAHKEEKSILFFGKDSNEILKSPV